MSAPEAIYLDYNATTPCAPEVLTAMMPFFGSDFGNASSTHLMGRKSARAVSDARDCVAETISCAPEEVLFTSGATESNNIVLLGVASRACERRRIAVAAIEHKSVLEPSNWLSENGFDVVVIPVTSDGVTDVHAAEKLIDDHTLLVSVQSANNEIGTIQPVRTIAEIAHARGALVHADATQMLGKVATSVDELGVDFASLSGHKAYGPKGVGALFARRGTARAAINAVYRGGGQESDLRPGTLNVPAIVGFGRACSFVSVGLEEEARRIKMLRDSLERGLTDVCADAFVVGMRAGRLPGTTSVCFMGIPSDAILARIPLVCAGTGSACTSGAMDPSHVLLACGLGRDVARCVIRFSLGRYTTERDVDVAVTYILEAVNEVRHAYRSNS